MGVPSGASSSCRAHATQSVPRARHRPLPWTTNSLGSFWIPVSRIRGRTMHIQAQGLQQRVHQIVYYLYAKGLPYSRPNI